MDKKKVNVLGGIGNTDRSNRDADRVMHRGGASITLVAHISIAPPKVIKKMLDKEIVCKNDLASKQASKQG